MDVRFASLTAQLADRLNWILYSVNRSGGGKMNRPQQVHLDDFHAINRLGRKKRAKYFDEMTPEELSRRRKSTMSSIRSAKGI